MRRATGVAVFITVIAVLVAGLVTGATALFATGGSSADPLTYRDRLRQVPDVVTDARWEWEAAGAPTTVITGTARWVDRGRQVVWNERGFGVSTTMTLTGGKVRTETGDEYTVSSAEGKQRIEQDLFYGYDPLVVADRFGLTLQGAGLSRRGGAPCVDDTRTPCTASLRLTTTEDGRPTMAVLELRHANGVDRITFRYRYGR